MPRTSWPKVAVAAVLTLGLVVSLSGCVAVGGLVFGHLASAGAHKKSDAVDKGKPTAGECWHATFDGAVQYAHWTGGKPVSCNSAHQLVTFAVVTLTEYHVGSEFDSQGYVKNGLHDDASGQCLAFQDSHWGPVDATDALLKLKIFYPPDAQWKLGARWARCDFNMFAVGSSITKPSLGDLPSLTTLSHELASTPQVFDYCTTVPGGNLAEGPKGPGAVFASCDAHPTWTLASYITLTVAGGAPYPKPGYFSAAYERRCLDPEQDASHVTFPMYPTKSQWAGGDYVMQCWVRAK